MKKIISFVLSLLISLSSFMLGASDHIDKNVFAPAPPENSPALYAHALLNSDDTQAWQGWQSPHDDNFIAWDDSEKYFFLPSSADESRIDIYNSFSHAVNVNGTEIGAGKTATVNYSLDTDYTVNAGGRAYTLRFMRSGAEAAVYVNNSDADGMGTDLMTYLNNKYKNFNKRRTASATGAIVTPDGKIDNTHISKIKGRGNTSWEKSKKSYNVTYESKVSVAGMGKSKKYVLLANFGDDSLSRDRFLYDLSDAAGLPYAPDSRYVDLYVNGFYWGSYLMCEKISAGKSSLVNDIKAEGFLNDDGSVKEDFPFLCEIDPPANPSKDYFTETDSGNKITIKYPELEKGDKGYEEVKNYVKTKFDEFYNSIDSDSLSDYADIDSVTKLYLINELGKNYDAGVSSVFFVYKPDENGNYKFFGSPVWDYDNALGNALGVADALEKYGVDDYTEYTGWWCRYNGGDNNIMKKIAVNEEVSKAAPKIWFNSFVPAVNHFSGKEYSEGIDRELYTADEYFALVNNSAEMNYKSGWGGYIFGWNADHSRLTRAEYDSASKKMIREEAETEYGGDFTGKYGYCRDWMLGRAAWLSQEFAKQSQ